jgi:TfoX/Sxy family transcriptional regulator of competence genes
MNPQERFALLVEAFQSLPDITSPGRQPNKQFGSKSLKVKQKIFAMLVNDKLVVKLPRQRVEELVTATAGVPYDPRHDGRMMKEWIIIGPTTDEAWLDLAREAMEFVASGG